MNADEFVAALSGVHAGFENPFRCTRRTPERPARANELEDLLVRYDCSALAIGRVRFIAAPRPHAHGQVVAFFEAEHIVLLPDQRVAVFEHERFGDKLMECARDAPHFFDALLCFANMWSERTQWLPRLDDAARVCADRAGGEVYDDFYIGLSSFLEYGADDLPKIP